MSFATILLLAVALAADCFAASLALGARTAQEDPRTRLIFALKVATVFGAMQGLMPLAGFLFGTLALERVAAWGHWIAAGLLVVVALDMSREAFEAGRTERRRPPTSAQEAGMPGWKTLAALGIATSIDAFAVGFSLKTVGARAGAALATIALASLLFSLAGVRLGRIVRRRIGALAQLLGAFVLLAIAVRILAEHDVFG